MQVSEQGDEVFIELSGVAGRHQRILQALTQGPFTAGRVDGCGDAPLETADINVRAGADEMHIRLKGRSGKLVEALSIYRYLRHELVEQGDAPAQVEGVAAG
jgi:hypothetical protein